MLEFVPRSDPAAEQERAWVDDAVLALWTREQVLRERRRIGTEAFLHFTANQHLSGASRPTRVESKIGVVCRAKGLPAAFAYIEARLLPMFKRTGDQSQARAVLTYP